MVGFGIVTFTITFLSVGSWVDCGGIFYVDVVLNGGREF